MDAPPAPPPPADAARAPRSDRRARAALDALRTLLRDLYGDRFGVSAVLPDELRLRLEMRLSPARNWELVFDPPVAGQVEPQFEDAQAALDVYRRGRAYCFRCDGTACEHARPDSSLSVFAGYDAAGRPLWQEFAQAAVAARDERVDQLFGERPRVIAIQQAGRDLRGDQLAAFGRTSKTYAVLGQVAAGYYPAPVADRSGSARVAVTLQAVEARGPGGRLRLHLNTLATLPDGSDVEDHLAGEWQPALHRARAVAVRALEHLEADVRAFRAGGRAEEAREAMKRVPRILGQLREQLERGDRQGHRRTRHAEERRQEQRPVHKAFEDARAAKPGQVYFDDRAATFMVCGPKGRTHAFNAEGRHVTSFSLRPEALDLRLRSRRWRPLSADEQSTFALLTRALGACRMESDPS